MLKKVCDGTKHPLSAAWVEVMLQGSDIPDFESERSGGEGFPCLVEA
jgi:hypothetical protein